MAEAPWIASEAYEGEASTASASLAALEEVRSRLVDTGLLVVLIFGTPAFGLVVLRASRLGWSSLDWLYATAIAWGSLAALLRSRLSLAGRTIALIGTIWIGGAAATVSFGPAGLGLVILVTAVVVAALVAGPRVGLGVLIASAGLLAIAAWWAPLGVDTAGRLSAYLEHPVMAIVRTTLFVFLAGCLLLLARRNSQLLMAAIDRGQQQRNRLGRALAQVESEVEERRRAERALRWTQFSLDQARTPILWLRPDSSISYANAAAARLLDCSLDTTLSRTLVELDAERDAASWEALLETLRREGELRLETSLLRPGGGRVPVELTINYGVFEENELLFAIVRDLTEMRRMEREQRRLQRRLEQSKKMEAVGSLAGGIAHDFNNLLQAIRGNAELLTVVNEARRTAPEVTEILEATDRAAELVRQLLTFSRQMPVRRAIVDLGGVIDDTTTMLARLIGEDIELVIEPADRPLTVLADRHQLEQILVNLVLNARDAMPDGGRLTIRTSLAGDDIRLEVVDTGEGIPPEIVDRIFEPFFTTKETEGTGLGLAIVYGLVEDLDGAIEVDSRPGEGTSVIVTMPRTEGREAEPDAVAEERVGYGSETVLLVEDDGAVRRVIARALEERGFRVLEAGDAIEAEAALAAHGSEISGLVLDVVLPGRSGLEIYRDAQARRPGIPVLFSSGYGAERVDEALLARREVDRIQKPYSGDELARALRSVLDAAGSAAAAGGTVVPR